MKSKICKNYPNYYKITKYLYPLMAWFEVDIFKKCIEVDLHDYSHRTALKAAREKIKEKLF